MYRGRMNTNVITGLGLCSVKYHFVEECHECEGREGGGVQTIIATTIITTASARHLRGTFLGSVSYWICPPFVFSKSEDRCNIDGPEDINDNQEGRQAVNHSILSASAAMPCNAMQCPQNPSCTGTTWAISRQICLCDESALERP